MDFVDQLNSKNAFGIFTNENKSTTIINIVCGVLLIALIVVLIICLVRKDNFKNKVDSSNGDEVVMMFLMKSCPYCIKQKQELEKVGNKLFEKPVKMIDMQDPNNSELVKKYGVTGAPSFVNMNTGTIAVGYHSDLKILENKLSGNNEPPKSSEDIIMLLGNTSCPFCKKAIQLMDSLNIKYKFIDITKEENKDLSNKHMTAARSNGVPLTYVKGEYIIGFDEDKIRALAD